MTRTDTQGRSPPVRATMRATMRATLALLACLAGPALAQVTMYEHEAFNGRSFSADSSVENLVARGFNDRASSVVVQGQRWQVCDDAGYGGRCVVLAPGRYPSLKAMGLNDRISSLRPDDWRQREEAQARESQREAQREADRVAGAAATAPPEQYRRKRGERVYEARVTSVRAVEQAGERRCWTEREPEASGRGKANVPGAVIGAVIGGVLGHQIGGGTGRDIATVGGVVAGAAVGSQVGREDTRSRDVERCTEAPRSAQPEYWDVSYEFRGETHRAQMSSRPGKTITVNRQGEPRV